MKHWILMFRPDTYEQVKEKNTTGVLKNHRNRFAELAPGDKFIAYVSRVRELASYGEIAGEPYVDEVPLFPNWDRYPHRCAISVHRTGAHLPANELLFRGLHVADALASRIPIAKGNLISLHVLNAIIGEGDAMGVAAKIFQRLFGPSERWLAVHHPFRGVQAVEELLTAQ